MISTRLTNCGFQCNSSGHGAFPRFIGAMRRDAWNLTRRRGPDGAHADRRRLRWLAKRDLSARSVPHISLTLSVLIVRPGLGASNVMRREQAHTTRAGGYVPADMLCQFRVRACADWTRATGDRVWRRLLERAIDGARDLPRARDAHQTATASRGGRRVSGSSSRPPVGQGTCTSSAFVVHGDLARLGFQPDDLVVAVIAFFQGCRGACERTFAPPGQPGDRFVSRPTGELYF
jgi:hypothetical protein